MTFFMNWNYIGQFQFIWKGTTCQRRLKHSARFLATDGSSRFANCNIETGMLPLVFLLIRLFVYAFLYTICNKLYDCFEIHTCDFSYDFWIRLDSNVFSFQSHTQEKKEGNAFWRGGGSCCNSCRSLRWKQQNKTKNRKRRKDWVKPWLKKRKTHGFYSQLLNELRLEECDIYENYLRMKPKNFEEIFLLVRDRISRQSTHLRELIAPEIKLAITIRFLASGNSYSDLSSAFHDAIYKELKDKYLKVNCCILYKFSLFKYAVKEVGVVSLKRVDGRWGWWLINWLTYYRILTMFDCVFLGSIMFLRNWSDLKWGHFDS